MTQEPQTRLEQAQEPSISETGAEFGPGAIESPAIGTESNVFAGARERQNQAQTPASDVDLSGDTTVGLDTLLDQQVGQQLDQPLDQPQAQGLDQATENLLENQFPTPNEFVEETLDVTPATTNAFEFGDALNKVRDPDDDKRKKKKGKDEQSFLSDLFNNEVLTPEQASQFDPFDGPNDLDLDLGGLD